MISFTAEREKSFRMHHFVCMSLKAECLSVDFTTSRIIFRITLSTFIIHDLSLACFLYIWNIRWATLCDDDRTLCIHSCLNYCVGHAFLMKEDESSHQIYLLLGGMHGWMARHKTICFPHYFFQKYYNQNELQ